MTPEDLFSEYRDEFGWADDRIVSLVQESKTKDVSIEVRIDYQACDDRTCRIPQSETLTVVVPVAPYLGHELPGRMPSAIITSMDTRKYMPRKVARGLLRSPLKGFRYMKQSMQYLRKWPLGRRRRD